jgi:hypothetical protein
VARGGRRSDPGPPGKSGLRAFPAVHWGTYPARKACLGPCWRVAFCLGPKPPPTASLLASGVSASPAMVSAGDCRTSPTKPSAPPARRGGLQARTSPCSAGGAFWPRGPWAARGPRGGGWPPGKPAGSGGTRKRGTEPLWCAPGQAAWGKLGVASERDGPYLLLRGLVRLPNYGFTKKALGSVAYFVG